MADGKWIQGLRPEMEIREAAEIVLRVRFDVVAEQLPLVMQQAHEDPEHVHQLRVATRRADAALRIFHRCLPRKAYRAGRARLRAIRRAAGAARDWDVFLLALRQRNAQAAEAEHVGLDFLIGYSLGQRAAAEAALAAIEEDEEQPFPEYVDDLLGELRPPEKRPERMGELARDKLATLLTRLETAAGGNLKDYDQLHRVRIVAKRLRYAVEVLADCLPEDFRGRLYPQIEEVQETLGRANDSHVAAQRLLGLRYLLTQWPDTWARVLPGLEPLLRFHQRRLPAERRRFLKWWEAWRLANPAALVAEPAPG
ncbi:MAG: CHAD domain-containing protein [Gemmataceae bacterium]